MGDRPTWDLPAIIAAGVENRLLTVHTHLVAKVVKYDPVRQRVDVQPEVREPKYGEDGSRTAKPMPVLVDLPVAWPQFGGFRMVGPLNPGDRVLVEFMEHSLDRWKPTGGDVDPADGRRFHIADAVAIPGVTDAAHALKNAPTDRMSLGYDEGVTVEIHPTELRLGGDDASDPVVRKSDLDHFIQNDYNTHYHLVPNVSGGSTTQSTVAPATSSATPACSSVVKAK